MSDYQQPQYGDQRDDRYGNESAPAKGPYDAPYQSPGQKRGMSGCAKAAIIFAVLGVIGTLVCCVGLGLYVRSIAKTDPAEVRQIADQIVEWDYSDEMTPTLAVNVFDVVRMAMFADPERGTITIFDTRFADAEAMSKEMNRQMKGQARSDDRLIEKTEVTEEDHREVEIRGETYRLQFNKSRGKESGNEYREISGVFPGNEYGVFVNMKLRTDQYDDEQILERFRSLK